MTLTATVAPQTAMLNEVLELILTDPRMDSEEAAFDALLHIIAYELSYEPMIQTPWMQESILEGVKEILDLELLRQDRWDWLGEVYELRNGSRDYLMDRATVQAAAAEFDLQPARPKLPTVLDTVAGSGRLILAISDEVKDAFPVIYYGAEPDLLAYRMALVNFSIYNLQFRILCANSETCDVRSHSPNWKYSNRWKPVADKKLFTKAENDDLGLKALQDPPLVYYY